MSRSQLIRIPGHVILNPENDDHVARLADAFCKARWSHLPGSDECDPLTRSSMQAALHSLIAPPKPYTEHDGAEPPWPVTNECHGHKWVAWTARRAGSGIPIRCSTCGVRKCDRDMCALERHHDGTHSDLSEGVS